MGTSGNDIDIDTSATGSLTSNATSIYVTEVSGPLRVNHAIATTGDVRLTVPETAGTTDNLIVLTNGEVSSAGGTATLRAGDNINVNTGAVVKSQKTTGDTVFLIGDYNDNDAAGTTITVDGQLFGRSIVISGNADDDSFIFNNPHGINANTGLGVGVVIVDGAGGTDSVLVDESAGSVADTGAMTSTNLTGLGMGYDGIKYAGTGANVEDLKVQLTQGADTFTIHSSNAGTLTHIFGNGANDTLNVEAISGATDVHGGDGNDVINIGFSSGGYSSVDGIQAALTVAGDAHATGDQLNIIETNEPATMSHAGTLTSTTITGLGMGAAGVITYGTIEDLTITLGQGDDNFTIASTHSGTTELYGKQGNDTLNIQSVSGATTVNGDTGNDTVNVGSTAGTAVAGNVNSINALLTVNGGADSGDVLNIDDSSDVSANTGSLTSSRITGLGMAANDATKGISYSGVPTLNITLGSGDDTFNIASTQSATTNVRTGGGADIINVVTAAGFVNLYGGDGNDTFNLNNVDGILTGLTSGLVTLDGQGGTDSALLDDSADTTGDTGAMTNANINGLGMGGGAVNYTNVEDLTIKLSQGADTFAIHSTNAATATHVFADGGDDTINVEATSGATDVHGGDGNDTINVGYSNGSFYTVNNIQGALTVAGDAHSTLDQLNIIETNEPAASSQPGFLTSTTVTGLGMGAAITYGTVEDLTIKLGLGNDTFTIQSTHSGTTELYGYQGNDTLNVQSVSGITTVNGGTGNDIVNVGSTAGTTTPGNVNAINALLTINGGADSGDVLNVDDSGDTAPNTGSLTSATITGLGMAGNDASKGITYGGFPTLNITLGSGGDTFTINSTHAGTTNLQAGGGNDTVNVETIGGVTNVLGGVGDDTINVNPDTANPSLNNGLAALLTLDGQNGSDLYNINVWGNGDSHIVAIDHGTGVSDANSMVINGTAAADSFLLRRNFFAAIHTGTAERVDYDQSMNGGLTLNALGGDDYLAVDDNSTVTHFFGGSGNDTVQVGQMFNSPRDVPQVANGDQADTILTTKGYLTNGASFALDAHGGTGDDTFVMFHNTATVTLVGDEDNDAFIVRAFALASTGKVDTNQQVTNVNGGGGNDSINYTVNAPVAIDGGGGSDKVVVVGTEFGDTIVVTDTAVYGAGLAVSYLNVEWLQIEAGEGDDSIYVLSTSPGVKTEIFGGLGNDHFYTGENAPAVVSNDLLGYTGLIAHSVDTSIAARDTSYDGITVPGISAHVMDDLTAGVIVTPTGAGTTVVEGGAADTYTVRLTKVPAADVKITVNIPVLSPDQIAAGFKTLLVSSGGSTPGASVVLTFTPTTWNVAQTVSVTAPNEGKVEGSQVLPITHSVTSTDTAYNRLPVANLNVKIIDVSASELVLTESGASTDVLENDSTMNDTYTVGLTRAPSGSVTVTVTPDPGITVSGGGGTGAGTSASPLVLTLNSGNWSGVTLTVSAPNDGTVQGTIVSHIKHAVTGGDSAFAGQNQTLLLNRYDDDAPDVIVMESDGSTNLLEGGIASSTGSPLSDTYQVRLTKAPVGGSVTIKVTPAPTLTSYGQPAATQVSTNVATLTFDSTKPWNVFQTVKVIAPDDGVADYPYYHAFGQIRQTLQGIQGPLNIVGGESGNPATTIPAPLMLPTESNPVVNFSPLVPPPVDETKSVDTLNVNNTDSRSNDVGYLTSTRLYGLGMGGDQTISGALVNGGITYGGLEIIDVALGSGNDTMNVSSVAANAITALRGNAGDDSFVITAPATNGALVVYGDNAASSLFRGNPGNDNIDASASGLSAILYGGAGNDTVKGGTGNDLIAGGSGNDNISANSGDDVVFGDSGFDVNLATGKVTVVTSGKPGLDNFDNPGNDTITDGTGTDVIFGDHGAITQVGGTLNVWTPGDTIQTAETTNELLGGTDNITAGDGRKFIFGGFGADTVTSGSGNDVILGDNGAVYFNLDGTPATLDRVLTRLSTTGGNDVLNGGDGADVILGGYGNDTVHGNAGNDVILGDNGQVDFTGGNLVLVQTTNPADGGADSIFGDAGNDYIAGGAGGDNISGGDGADVVLGDNGQFTFQGDGVPGTLNVVSVTDPSNGGNDSITGDAGDDVLIGGTGTDTVSGGDNNDLIAGDHATYDRTTPSNAIFVSTFFAAANGGAADTLNGDAGNDIILGGNGGDTINAGDGNDLVFGDHATINGNIDLTKLPLALAVKPFTFTSIDTTVVADGGNDNITGGSGDDILIGGQGGDTVNGNAGNDDIIGGHNVPGGADTGDWLDGGSGDDVIAGDNASILRTGGSGDTLYRVLSGVTIYDANGNPLVTQAAQNNPGSQERAITLYDHSTTAPASTFGNDYIAGGAGNDRIFGQLGNDTIQGDGSILLTVGASRNATNDLTVQPSTDDYAGAGTDGNDYIEGGGGADVIFGNLGQDDIIGGSSSLFSLNTPDQRPDGADMIFGGSGNHIARNDAGDTSTNGHARDADVIVGDNGNIYRLVGVNGTAAGAATGIAYSGGFLSFNYDDYNTGGQKIIVRGVQLLDYTPGGPSYNAAGAATDIGGADEVHGESGDDFIYAGKGNDAVFGDGQDDNIFGGYGNDWISGGSGDDGILGDDGIINTSRNGKIEPLNGVTVAVTPATVATGGNAQTAAINVANQLKKSVDLTPFSTDPSWTPAGDEFNGQTQKNSDDIIFGGLGNDSMHGGSGDDAISGAEALPLSYAPTYDASGNPNGIVKIDFNHPFNPGNVLAFNPIDVNGQHANAQRAGEFALYDEYDPLRKILLNNDGTANKTGTGVEFFLNFNATEGPASTLDSKKTTDGDDKIFGDLGNDWMVGGSGRDDMYGGFGNDLMNADDDLTTASGANNAPDTSASYEDRAYGGAGRDVLIANTGGDRLIDWVGEYNSYLVPFSPFGNPTVSRTLQPALMDFLYALSRSDGADPTRVVNGADPARNGEPYGELGLVLQKDADWREQHGGPADPQPGNSNGQRDVLRSADFSTGAQGFSPQVGTFTIVNNRYQVAPATAGGDAISLFNESDTVIPSYFEMQALINAVKPIAGSNANAYLIFDWHSNTDFKFAGVNISTNKLEIGHRTDTGWVVDSWVNGQLKSGIDYVVMLTVNGNTATLSVAGTTVAFAFADRVDSWGIHHFINEGVVGIGARDGTQAQIDDVVVQVPPATITLDKTVDFTVDSPASGLFNSPTNGTWTTTVDGRFVGSTTDATKPAIDLIGTTITPGSMAEITATLKTTGQGGVVFDYQGPTYYKFATVSADSKQILIGHRVGTATVIDRAFNYNVSSTTDYKLGVTLRSGLVNVSLNGSVVASYLYNETVTIGGFGVISLKGSSSSSQTSFDSVRLRTDDAQYLVTTTTSPSRLAETSVAVLDVNTARAFNATAEESEPAYVPPASPMVDWESVSEDVFTKFELDGAIEPGAQVEWDLSEVLVNV